MRVQAAARLPPGRLMDVGPIDQARTRDLRRRVLRPEFALDDPLPGDDLPQAVHIGAVDGDSVIGACFVYEDPCYWRPDDAPAWRLKQMASAPDRRGEGVGGAVLRAAVAVVVQRGASLLWCHARESAVAFYATHGFSVDSAVFIDPDLGIAHRRMSVELPRAPISSVR